MSIDDRFDLTHPSKVIYCYPVWGIKCDANVFCFDSVILRDLDLMEWLIIERRDIFDYLYTIELAAPDRPSKMPACLLGSSDYDDVRGLSKRSLEFDNAVGAWTLAMRLSGYSEFVDPLQAGLYVRWTSLNVRSPSYYRQDLYGARDNVPFPHGNFENICKLFRELTEIQPNTTASPLLLALDNFRHSYDLYIGLHSELSLRFTSLENIHGHFGPRGASRYRGIGLLERLTTLSTQNGVSLPIASLREIARLRNGVAHNGAIDLSEVDQSLFGMIEGFVMLSILDCLKFFREPPEYLEEVCNFTGESVLIHAYRTLMSLCYSESRTAIDLCNLYRS
ncbi:hypothetical protein ABZT02_16450 [Streptomyces sp. NPDC005402]|uniref:hypothetical protein n=1 Tax=Streptomyces sp. NPDC005402 TaxID=3155338 RepID=UPI0033A403F8